MLINLQQAQVMLNPEEYARLLDHDFVFHFWGADVSNGDVLADDWDRAAEVLAFSYMAGEPSPTGIQAVADPTKTETTSVEQRSWGYIKNYFLFHPWDEITMTTLVLDYTPGDAGWQSFYDTGAGETRYRKAAGYELTVETLYGSQFEKLDGAAVFVVRQLPGVGQWRLVEWYDNDYGDLTDKEDVFWVLENAYNNRNFGEVTRLLDNNFTFFFSPADISNGYTPFQWDRAAELSATSHLFDPNYPTNPIDDISVDIVYSPGPWLGYNPPSAPSETWYQKTAYYTLAATAGEYVFMAFNVEMQLTIRFESSVDGGIWRVVEWRDVGVVAAETAQTATTEEVTWGHLKALYE